MWLSTRSGFSLSPPWWRASARTKSRCWISPQFFVAEKDSGGDDSDGWRFVLMNCIFLWLVVFLLTRYLRHILQNTFPSSFLVKVPLAQESIPGVGPHAATPRADVARIAEGSQRAAEAFHEGLPSHDWSGLHAGALGSNNWLDYYI